MSFGRVSSDLPREVRLHLAPMIDTVEVSVVLPCLNEEASVVASVAEARRALDGLGVTYEVIVVDNGSVDRSASRARLAGADVIDEPGIGYGNACRRGLHEARGHYVVIGDADATYDFSAIPRLLQLLDDGADLALGNRLEGNMEPGAMPWLHRRLGTPVISGVINLLFGVGVGDVNCGLRAVRRSAYRHLDISATGMEFASEMVVRAAENGLSFAETPVDYRLRIGGEPKLRTWFDGWRHMRLVMGSWVRHVARRGVARLVPSPGLPATEPEFRRSGEFDADRSRL